MTAEWGHANEAIFHLESVPRYVLFATAELSPLCRVGGLADASAGLVDALRRAGAHVDVVIPDFDGTPSLVVEHEVQLDVPSWVGPTVARVGTVPGVGGVIAITNDVLRRSHPYNQPATGIGWEDNDVRFLGFSAAVAAVARLRKPDVVHLNDWHTAAAVAWLPAAVPVVLTIHNLAYQGETGAQWLERLGPRRAAFDRDGTCNPLAGGIALADQVIAVSPTYAAETRRPGKGAGLEELLRARHSSYSGIRNGIDVSRWDPATDPHLPTNFSLNDLRGKSDCRSALMHMIGLPDLPDEPVIGVLCRFVDQKGVDIALDLAHHLRGMPGRLVLMGRGEAELEAAAIAACRANPLQVGYLQESAESLAHLVMAGSDMLLVPSRFEPCGLTPMEAMRCGTIPVVTPVGGLRDSVVDASGNEAMGNGFIAPATDPVGVSLALSRAVRAWSDESRRAQIRKVGMTTDWSWRMPAQRYMAVYDDVVAARNEPSRAAEDATARSTAATGALDSAPAS